MPRAHGVWGGWSAVAGTMGPSLGGAPVTQACALGSLVTKPWSFVTGLGGCQAPRAFPFATLFTMSDAAANPTSAPAAPSDSLEVIRKFAETYAQRTGTYFCSDPGVTAVVLAGLAKHKDELGGALCPCRHYEDKEAEVSQAFWNCPCVPMRERKECHCMLFLTEDNPFRGEQQTISLEEVKALSAS